MIRTPDFKSPKQLPLLPFIFCFEQIYGNGVVSQKDWYPHLFKIELFQLALKHMVLGYPNSGKPQNKMVRENNGRYVWIMQLITSISLPMPCKVRCLPFLGSIRDAYAFAVCTHYIWVYDSLPMVAPWILSYMLGYYFWGICLRTLVFNPCLVSPILETGPIRIEWKQS